MSKQYRVTTAWGIACVALWYLVMAAWPRGGDRILASRLYMSSQVRHFSQTAGEDPLTIKEVRRHVSTWVFPPENSYSVEVQADGPGWIVVCTPAQQVTRAPLWRRVLVLDFEKHHWPRYVLRSSDLKVEQQSKWPD